MAPPSDHVDPNLKLSPKPPGGPGLSIKPHNLPWSLPHLFYSPAPLVSSPPSPAPHPPTPGDSQIHYPTLKPSLLHSSLNIKLNSAPTLEPFRLCLSTPTHLPGRPPRSEPGSLMPVPTWHLGAPSAQCSALQSSAYCPLGCYLGSVLTSCVIWLNDLASLCLFPQL